MVKRKNNKRVRSKESRVKRVRSKRVRSKRVRTKKERKTSRAELKGGMLAGLGARLGLVEGPHAGGTIDNINFTVTGKDIHVDGTTINLLSDIYPSLIPKRNLKLGQLKHFVAVLYNMNEHKTGERVEAGQIALFGHDSGELDGEDNFSLDSIPDGVFSITIRRQ